MTVVTPPRRRREGLERRFEATDFFNLDEHPPDMDEVLDVFELDLGELVEGGFQLLVSALLLVLGVVSAGCYWAIASRIGRAERG